MSSAVPTVAAVDLGSNSFHMVIARLSHGTIHVIDRIKEPVRLAEGLDASKKISKKAQKRGLACLGRFAERLRAVHPERVRVVGTNTLRLASNAEKFREAAEERLGHPVEVISGQEEARLIYLAVAQTHASSSGRSLVVDIGGGSTEIVLGQGHEIRAAHSLYMGCVSYSQRFFPGGEIGSGAFKQALTAARLELRPIDRELRRAGWDVAIGTSGTIGAIEEIVDGSGWSSGGIDADGLQKLRRTLVKSKVVESLSLPGVKQERAEVLPGGVAILAAVFDALRIDRMSASACALRDGVLIDLLGRMGDDDARDRTIRRLAQQYQLDREQACRVESTALGLLRQVSDAWRMDREWSERVLVWAAQLHEIGLAVSHGGYHKHGAYLLRHSVMAGFSSDEQKLLAAIVRNHRRKIFAPAFDELPESIRSDARRLCVLLRIAVLLNRSRRPRAPLPFEVSAGKSSLSLKFDKDWLAEHPLTLADLEKESGYLAGEELEFDVEVAKGQV